MQRVRAIFAFGLAIGLVVGALAAGSFGTGVWAQDASPAASPGAATPAVSPSPTSPPQAGTVLYAADFSAAPAAPSEGWNQLNGALASDGSGLSLFVPAFRVTYGLNYAVEAEIQMASCGQAFGLLARGVSDDERGIWGTLSCGNAYILAGPKPPRTSDTVAQQPFLPDRAWHVYRVEVRGSAYALSVDGKVIVEGTDTRFLEGDVVGVYSWKTQTTVRAFRVIAL
jgi:hypothetical protein